MNKLTKEQFEKVEIAKQLISSLQNTQEGVYENLSKELDQDNDWLYDYVFNCSVEDEYTKTVREKIFK